MLCLLLHVHYAMWHGKSIPCTLITIQVFAALLSLLATCLCYVHIGYVCLLELKPHWALLGSKKISVQGSS